VIGAAVLASPYPLALLDEAMAVERETDRALARRIAGGDGDAFEHLVRRHHPHVARIAGRFFRRPEIVEEIVQEAFVKALTGIAGYRGEMPLSHWLARITVNVCYDQLRRQKARPEISAPGQPDDAVGFFERLAAPEGSPDARFWEREESRLLSEQLLARLSPAERLVLTLTVLEELSTSEVAQRTGWSTANVKIRAFRARAKLRGMMGIR